MPTSARGMHCRPTWMVRSRKTFLCEEAVTEGENASANLSDTASISPSVSLRLTAPSSEGAKALREGALRFFEGDG